jgi:hypothetical protein
MLEFEDVEGLSELVSESLSISCDILFLMWSKASAMQDGWYGAWTILLRIMRRWERFPKLWEENLRRCCGLD